MGSPRVLGWVPRRRGIRCEIERRLAPWNVSVARGRVLHLTYAPTSRRPRHRGLRRSRRAFPAALVCTAAGFALVARVSRATTDDPPRLLLDWSAPSSCQVRGRVESAVERLRTDDRTGDERIEAHAEVTPVERRWKVVLTIRHGASESVRELTAESCAAAADATALILALTFGSSSTAPAAPDAGAPIADPRPQPDVVTPSPRVPQAPPPRDVTPQEDASPEETTSLGAPSEFRLFAEAEGDVGTLPRPAVGFGLGAAWEPPQLRLEASASYWPPVGAGTSAQGGTFQMVTFNLRGCLRAELPPFAFGPCLGWEPTWMLAQGYGVAVTLRGSSWWSVVTGDAMATVQLSKNFSLRMRVGLGAPTSRPTFAIEGAGPVHQPAAAALQIGVASEVHF